MNTAICYKSPHRLQNFVRFVACYPAKFHQLIIPPFLTIQQYGTSRYFPRPAQKPHSQGNKERFFTTQKQVYSFSATNKTLTRF